MKRQVYLNDVPYIQMYSSESGSNTGNCSTNCSSCGGSGNVYLVAGGGAGGGTGGGTGGGNNGGGGGGGNNNNPPPNENWIIAMVSAGITVVGNVISDILD